MKGSPIGFGPLIPSLTRRLHWLDSLVPRVRQECEVDRYARLPDGGDVPWLAVWPNGRVPTRPTREGAFWQMDPAVAGVDEERSGLVASSPWFGHDIPHVVVATHGQVGHGMLDDKVMRLYRLERHERPHAVRRAVAGPRTALMDGHLCHVVEIGGEGNRDGSRSQSENDNGLDRNGHLGFELGQTCWSWRSIRRSS